MIDACSEPVPISGCGGRACSVASSASRRSSTRPSRRIASCPSARPAAVRGSARASRPSTHANPLWPTRDRQVGRLGDDRGVGAPLLHQRVGADARVLFVDDRGDDRAGRAASRRSRDARAAAIIAATPPFMSCAPRPYSRPSRSTGMNGSVMPATPTVSVWPQNISVRPWLAPSSTPTTLGRPGATSSTCTSRPARASRRRRRRRSLLARRAGHERRVDRIDRRRDRAAAEWLDPCRRSLAATAIDAVRLRAGR